MAGICSRQMSDTEDRVDAQPLNQGHEEEPSKYVETFGQCLLLRIIYFYFFCVFVFVFF